MLSAPSSSPVLSRKQAALNYVLTHYLDHAPDGDVQKAIDNKDYGRVAFLIYKKLKSTSEGDQWLEHACTLGDKEAFSQWAINHLNSTEALRRAKAIEVIGKNGELGETESVIRSRLYALMEKRTLSYLADEASGLQRKNAIGAAAALVRIAHNFYPQDKSRAHLTRMTYAIKEMIGILKFKPTWGERENYYFRELAAAEKLTLHPQLNQAVNHFLLTAQLFLSEHETDSMGKDERKEIMELCEVIYQYYKTISNPFDEDRQMMSQLLWLRFSITEFRERETLGRRTKEHAGALKSMQQLYGWGTPRSYPTAAEGFEKAASEYNKKNSPSRAANCYLHAALAYQGIKHTKAEDNLPFLAKALDCYEKAATCCQDDALGVEHVIQAVQQSLTRLNTNAELHATLIIRCHVILADCYKYPTSLNSMTQELSHRKTADDLAATPTHVPAPAKTAEEREEKRSTGGGESKEEKPAGPLVPAAPAAEHKGMDGRAPTPYRVKHVQALRRAITWAQKKGTYLDVHAYCERASNLGDPLAALELAKLCHNSEVIDTDATLAAYKDALSKIENITLYKKDSENTHRVTVDFCIDIYNHLKKLSAVALTTARIDVIAKMQLIIFSQLLENITQFIIKDINIPAHRALLSRCEYILKDEGMIAAANAKPAVGKRLFNCEILVAYLRASLRDDRDPKTKQYREDSFSFILAQAAKRDELAMALYARLASISLHERQAVCVYAKILCLDGHADNQPLCILRDEAFNYIKGISSTPSLKNFFKSFPDGLVMFARVIASLEDRDYFRDEDITTDARIEKIINVYRVEDQFPMTKMFQEGIEHAYGKLHLLKEDAHASATPFAAEAVGASSGHGLFASVPSSSPSSSPSPTP